MDIREAMSIFGINVLETKDELKSLYRKLMKKYHPDMGGTEEDAVRVGDAYSILCDAIDKRFYERKTSSTWVTLSEYESLIRGTGEVHRDGLIINGLNYKYADIDVVVKFDVEVDGETDSVIRVFKAGDGIRNVEYQYKYFKEDEESVTNIRIKIEDEDISFETDKDLVYMKRKGIISVGISVLRVR